MIAGLIYIDNYDEVMESVEEVRQSLLVALIDRKINKYIGDVDGILKKLQQNIPALPESEATLLSH